MNPALKKKLIMFVAMISFMAFFMIVFGSKNAVIVFVIVLAAFMSRIRKNNLGAYCKLNKRLINLIKEKMQRY